MGIRGTKDVHEFRYAAKLTITPHEHWEGSMKRTYLLHLLVGRISPEGKAMPRSFGRPTPTLPPLLVTLQDSLHLTHLLNEHPEIQVANADTVRYSQCLDLFGHFRIAWVGSVAGIDECYTFRSSPAITEQGDILVPLAEAVGLDWKLGRGTKDTHEAEIPSD